MERIKVSSDMEERILKNLTNEKTRQKKNNRKSYFEWIKSYGSIAACCAAVLVIALIYNAAMKSPSSVQQIQKPITINNPIVSVKNIDELKKAVSFELLVPDKLPAGFSIEKLSVISRKIAEINYTNGIDKIVYRTAGGSDDVSGDYASYETTEITKVNNTEVTLKGNNSLINLATWSQNGISFSLSFSRGTDKETVVNIIKNMKKI